MLGFWSLFERRERIAISFKKEETHRQEVVVTGLLERSYVILYIQIWIFFCKEKMKLSFKSACCKIIDLGQRFNSDESLVNLE